MDLFRFDGANAFGTAAASGLGQGYWGTKHDGLHACSRTYDVLHRSDDTEIVHPEPNSEAAWMLGQITDSQNEVFERSVRAGMFFIKRQFSSAKTFGFQLFAEIAG